MQFNLFPNDDGAVRYDERIKVFDTHFEVASKSEPGVWRAVSLEGECDCMAGVNGRKCWHITLLRDHGLLPPPPVPDFGPVPWTIPGLGPGPDPWLWTGRYGNKTIAQSGLVPVQTSIGLPQFPINYRLEWSLGLVTPAGFMLNLDPFPYQDHYRRKLDDVGVDGIMDALQVIVKSSGGRGILLLCFEDLREPHAFCHRQVLRQWLEEHVPGLMIPELAEVWSL